MTSLSSLPTHYVQSLFHPNTATGSFTSTTTCKPHALHNIFLSSPFHEFRPVKSFSFPDLSQHDASIVPKFFQTRSHNPFIEPPFNPAGTCQTHMIVFGR